MAKDADAAMRAICEAVEKRENTDAMTVRMEFLGLLAAVTTRADNEGGAKTYDEETHGDHVRLARHDCPAVDEGGGTGDGWRRGVGSRGALSPGFDLVDLVYSSGSSILLAPYPISCNLRTWAWIDSSCLPALVTALCF